MENEEYAKSTTKFESELLNSFPLEYNKKLGESLLTERLLKYSNSQQNHHHPYEEKENEKIPPYVDNFMASPDKISATITAPYPTPTPVTHQIPLPGSRESSNYIEMYSKIMNGHSDVGSGIADSDVSSRNSIKRKAGEHGNHYDNDGINYLMKYKKQFSNKISSSYASSIPPDLDLPLDIFNEPSVPVSLPSPVPHMAQLPPAPTPSRSNINPFAMKDCSEEIKKILKEKIKLNRNGGKLMKGLINELGGQITNEYAQYLGLQPAVKFKCFKCGESQFPSLLELKDHQMICLNKSGGGGCATKSSNNSNATNNKLNNNSNCKSNTESSNNKINKLVNSNGNSTNNSNNDPSTKIRITRKVFLCSACGTYYENWNLFLHMREVHQRHTCLYCLGLFASSERLLNHLENKHNIKEKVYDSKEHLLTSFNNPCYLMCSNCEHVFSEMDNFHSHLCEHYLETCTVCGQKYVHKHNCNSSNNHNSNSNKAMAVKSTNKLNKDKDKKKIGNNQSSEKEITTQTRHSSMPLVNGNDHRQEQVQPTFLLPPPPEQSHHVPETLQIQESVTEKLPSTNPSLADVNSSIEERISSAESNSSSSVEEDSESSDDGGSPPPGDVNKFATIVSNTDENLDSSHQQKIVPKLKIKFNSKAFSTPIVSEVESSSEASDEEEEEDEEETVADEEEDDDDEGEENQSHENINQNQTDVVNDPITAPEDDCMDIEEPSVPELSVPEIKEIKSEVDSVLSVEQKVEPPENIKQEKPEIENKLEIFGKNDLESVISPVQATVDTVKKSVVVSEPEQSNMDIDEEIHQPNSEGTFGTPFEIPVIKTEPPADDDIVEASDDTQLFELRLNSPLDRIDIKEFIGICLQSSVPFCLYCNHARRILVNAKALALHLIAAHRYSATVNSITAEELLPSTIVIKLKSHLDTLDALHFSLDSLEECNTVKRDIFAPAKQQFECFQCRFVTNIHKELYLHNRKMHLKSILLCIMCKSNFYSYSELICHICPGTYNKVMILDLVFKCCLCELENIPSSFRLMVHLRKKHNACDVCLEECYDQYRLSNHVWKHKLHHLCYRCGIAYRNKPDITKHLFWKHGTESVECKKCLHKKWPHVFHFCIPPNKFTCECGLEFHKAVSLKVHTRLHSGDAKYPCTEDNCEKKFISRRLLLKHVARHSNVVEEIPMLDDDDIEYNEEGSEAERLDENEDSMKSGEEIIDENEKVKKDKRRQNQIKEEKESFDETIDKTAKPVIRDIMDLPALNLSESDSSDEEDTENRCEAQFTAASMPQDNDNEFEEPDANNVAPIMNIWDNFRSFQASQKKQVEDDDEEPNIPPPILHVVQSDHDYSMMYRPIKEIQEDLEDDKKMDEGIILDSKTKDKHSPSKKMPKSSDSSSSDSSSGSDSCSCGTDCSCSSSSSGSSSSSSSSDEGNNSSGSENRKKLTAAAKVEKIKKIEKKRQKVESDSAAVAAAAAMAAASQLNESLQQIDVVATDTKINITVDPDSIIMESDLETDESETDEDFYDEHPQKLANQILAEKRRQLMLQTCLNPMNNAIVENSRPSTPSIPEDVVKEKRIKIKKKKKKRNVENSPESLAQANILVPPLKISILNETAGSTPLLNKSLSPSMLPVANIATVLDSIVSTPPVGITPALISSNSRLSTGSGSETDGALKRSKRRRIPNRFYGYSSDEEAAAMSVMKPTPPPNLTWRKEDLPSPTNVKTPPVKTLKIRSPSLTKPPTSVIKTKSSRNSSPVNFYPPIPPVVIRPPSQTIPSQTLLIPPPIPPPSVILAQPPRVEPLRVPAVPVHHVLPPEFANSNFSEYSDNSDSDSSNEGSLQILQKPTAPLRTKIILTKPPAVPRIKKESIKRQTKISKTPKTPKITKNFIGSPLSNAAMSTPPISYQSTVPAQIFPARQILPPPPQTLQSQLIQQPMIQSPVNHPLPRLPGLKYPLFLPPRGTRTEPKEGESVYCYCQCPYDEVSEMIACDGEDCQIEWFHFECVGIMVPPKGKWYCPDCKPKYLSGNNEYLEEDNT